MIGIVRSRRARTSFSILQAIAAAHALLLLRCDTGDVAEPRAGTTPSTTADDAGGMLDSASTAVECVEADAGVDGSAAQDAALEPTFANVFAIVIEGTCTGCHSNSSAALGNLSLGDRCTAFKSLVRRPAIGPACGESGRVRVVPGVPDESLLLQKLVAPACGSRMPLGGSAVAPEKIELLRAWITRGAAYD